MTSAKVSPVVVCWWVAAVAAAAQVSASLIGAQAAAGQATAVALAALAAIVVLGAGPGWTAIAGGVSLLAVNAAWPPDPEAVTDELAMFWYGSPHEPKPYSAAEDLAWLGQSLQAQLVQNWLVLLAVPLICVGVIAAVRSRPPVEGRWPRRVAWVVVATVAILELADIAAVGPLPRQLITAGVMLPTMLVAGAALAVLVVAASRPGQHAVRIGAVLLMLAVFAAELSQVGPIRPVVLTDLSAFTAPGYSTAPISTTTAIGPGGSSGLVTAPLLALLPLLAISLLVAGSRRRIPSA